MAKPFTKANLTVEDCEDAPDWFVEGPLRVLNSFMVESDEALQGQLERGANLLGRIATGVRIATGTVVGDSFPMYLSTDGMARAPRAVWIGAVKTKSGTAPTAALQPIWEMASDGKRVKLLTVTGLNANETYTLTFLME